MQLTVDAEPPIDIEYKMSTIKEVSLKELITNNIVEMFSNEIKKSDDIVKDDEFPSDNNELQNVQLNNKDKQDDVTTATECKIENNTSEESLVNDCVSNSPNLKNSVEEINITPNIVCDEDTTNQQQELESQNKLNNVDLEEDENVNQMESNDVNAQTSSSVTSESEMNDQLRDDDINTKSLEDTINVSEIQINTNETENKVIIEKDVEENDVKEANKDKECLSNETSVSHSVTDEVFNETITEEVSNETVTDEVLNETITEEVSNKTVIDEVLNETVTDEVPNETVTDEALNETVTEKVLNENVTDEVLNETVTEEVSNETFTDEVFNETVTEEVANKTVTDEVFNETVTEKVSNKTVTDEVCNGTVTEEVFKEKKEQSLDVNQSQSVSQTSFKININQNESEKLDQEADLIIEAIAKDEISMKEKEITEKSAAITECDVKSSPIEISEKNTDDGEENSNDVDSKIDEDPPKSPQISKSSNVLDILSDDEDDNEDVHPQETADTEKSNCEKQCISLVDDDDVMLIDEETSVKEDTNSISINASNVVEAACDESAAPSHENIYDDKVTDVDAKDTESEEVADCLKDNELDGNNDVKENVTAKPLLPINFLNTYKKNLADMTREDLEDFCSLKIVESVMERSNLGELKSQIQTMAAAIEEFKKKTTLLNKQNKDLQLVLKSMQDVQKNSSYNPITPLKITRSVGMQVLMTDKPTARRKNAQITNSNAVPNQPLPADKSNRNTVPKGQKTKNQPIPVPRLVPAPNAVNKTSTTTPSNTTDPGKSPQMSLVNGLRISSDTQKPEKRSRLQSVTVDLTDDEPPMKVTARSSPAPAVRLVPAQNLLPPQRAQFAPTMSSPRKVYIPISGPQAQNVRPGQTVVLKTVPANPVPRPRMPANNVNKMQTNTIRMNRALPTSRHPAPLPDAVKQYQPTSWKALPPAPDLKLSKVENGIVISWKIDGYQDDSYEEIISYQLFAYQETNSPPSTALWKKIGDVKALPLPMACTLTQFLAGYKYYFAVRAVDVKSRFGPFSLPASILLLNKM